MTNARNNPQKYSNCYTLAEIHREIAVDEDWRTKFRFLPTASKAGLKFQAKNPRALLIGVHKHNEAAHVYARLYPAASGLYNLVAIEFSDGLTLGTRQQQRGEGALKLEHIKYIEPFDRLSYIGSRLSCETLRFLVFYYFLEQQAIDRCVFKRDGLKALKRVCTAIADGAIKKREKPLRLLLTVPITTHATKSTIQLSTEEDYDDEEAYFKQETSPVEPMKVPENNPARAVSTTVQQGDSIAARQLPKTRTVQYHPNLEGGLVPAVPKSVYKFKRKRPAKCQATSEDEEQTEEEDPELMFNRSKRIVRDRVQLQIESLEREETGAQDKLSAQIMSFNEALKSFSSHEKALMDAKAKAEVEQAAKTAVEGKLEKVRGELTEKRVFEKGFDSFHT
ncbi:hypothetical protein J4E91_003698 [Alternaria rosae]|nr:hypothetical protein J4E91_003698 [Alternaria rosae]